MEENIKAAEQLHQSKLEADYQAQLDAAQSDMVIELRGQLAQQAQHIARLEMWLTEETGQ